MLRVLVACEFSGIVRDAFIARGHDAMSCDLEPTEVPGPHYHGDVFDVIDYPWDVAIFHPPCTHTSVSGARHFAEKRMDGRQQAGVSFFMSLWRRSAHIPSVAFEQPVSVMSSLFRKPDQIIQPHMFGHPESKTTCLWLRGLPLLAPTDDVSAAMLDMPKAVTNRVHRMSPGPDRWRERSRTFTGVASAMAKQYPDHISRAGGLFAEVA